MGQTVEGAKKAVATILANNPDHFRRAGAIGGSACVPKGFAVRRDIASKAGTIGGRISRRRKAQQ